MQHCFPVYVPVSLSNTLLHKGKFITMLREQKCSHVCSSAPSNLYLNDHRGEENSIKQLLPILDGVSASTGILDILM